MARSTKESWLNGPGDLQTEVVEDVPTPGQNVLVTGLAAAFSNRASSAALEMKQQGRDQIASVNTEKLEVIQFAQGCVEPKFTEAEAQQIAERYGPAFRKVVAAIDRLSGVDKEAITEANARFQGGGESPNGADVGAASAAGSGGPDLDVRAR